MIYGKILEEYFYKKEAKNINIVFGNIILEDNHAKYETNKIHVDINIRTSNDGGRSNNVINHGPAVKLDYNNDLVDIFVKKDKRTNKFYCEIDRNYDNKKAIKLNKDKVYKTASKFILNNAEQIIAIWDTEEGSIEYNDLINQIKTNNPEFSYDK